MILLVVDTQKLIMTNNLYNFDSLVPNIEQLIVTARKNKIEIVYIRHDDGPNTELTEGKEGFEIYEKFQPTTLERIFDKSVNSAFKGTGLLEYLKEKSTKKIVIAGLQTDFCIDATVKCGFEHGFHMIVPAHANS
ncbi:cysteine hydrolase family protein, partial [Listeria monocytogenes]